MVENPGLRACHKAAKLPSEPAKAAQLDACDLAYTYAQLAHAIQLGGRCMQGHKLVGVVQDS